MTRILSGVVLIGAVLAAVWYAPAWLFLAVVALVVVGASIEYRALVAQTGITVPVAATVTAAVVTAIAVAWPGLPAVHVLATVVIALCLVSLGLNQPGPLVPASVAATVFPAWYIGLPLGLLAAVRHEFGREALLFVLAIVVASDTAQYYVGTWLGKHRLAPAISPKKSVEGAVAGLVAGAAIGVALGTVAWPSLGVLPRAALGLVLAGLGIGGDLFESLLKRSAGIKDSSALIPGHGGVLDRLDAFLLVVPAFYVFLHTLK